MTCCGYSILGWGGLGHTCQFGGPCVELGTRMGSEVFHTTFLTQFNLSSLVLTNFFKYTFPPFPGYGMYVGGSHTHGFAHTLNFCASQGHRHTLTVELALVLSRIPCFAYKALIHIGTVPKVCSWMQGSHTPIMVLGITPTHSCMWLIH